MDTVKSYELPFIRCFNCNKPLGHLYDEYYKKYSLIMEHLKKNNEIIYKYVKNKLKNNLIINDCLMFK